MQIYCTLIVKFIAAIFESREFSLRMRIWPGTMDCRGLWPRSDGEGGRNEGRYRHSRVGGSPWLERDWIPAYAGMTGGGAGMTASLSGQRPHFVIARSEATWQSIWAGVAGVSRFAFWMYCIDSVRLWF